MDAQNTQMVERFQTFKNKYVMMFANDGKPKEKVDTPQDIMERQTKKLERVAQLRKSMVGKAAMHRDRTQSLIDECPSFAAHKKPSNRESTRTETDRAATKGSLMADGSNSQVALEFRVSQATDNDQFYQRLDKHFQHPNSSRTTTTVDTRPGSTSFVSMDLLDFSTSSSADLPSVSGRQSTGQGGRNKSTPAAPPPQSQELPEFRTRQLKLSEIYSATATTFAANASPKPAPLYRVNISPRLTEWEPLTMAASQQGHKIITIALPTEKKPPATTTNTDASQ